jgi:serine/threonine-protein kinase
VPGIAENLWPLAPSQLFHDRYRVLRCIRSGGMGAIFEVVDERINAPRALKVLSPTILQPGDEHRVRFAVEARVTATIENDHIVRVFETGVEPASGIPFVVMELLRGEDLGAVMGRGPLRPADVVIYLQQVALALEKAHSAGIVHRDLKPENLFLTRREDGTPLVKVLDFGIAKVWRSVETGVRTRGVVGTTLYMAPEQILVRGAIGTAADIHGLGLVAYALLSGEAYWQDEHERHQSSPYVLALTMSNGPTEAPTVRARRRRRVPLPAAFDAWFATATAVKPDARFPRATDATAALASALGVTGRVVAVKEPAPAPIDPVVPAPSARAAPVTRPTPPPQARASSSTNEAQRPKSGYTVTIDQIRSIVRVKVWGFWSIEEARAYVDDFRAKSQIFWGKKWYVLADISDFTAQKPEVEACVKQTMEVAREHGMVRAANIVASALSKMQISRLSAEQGLPAFSFFQDDQEAIRWLLSG